MYLIKPSIYYLGSQLSAEPTFHWVLYEPNVEQSPMEIKKRNSEQFPMNAVLSPRWNGGGLQIVNEQVNEANCAGLIISQLRRSFGLLNFAVMKKAFHVSAALNNCILISFGFFFRIPCRIYYCFRLTSLAYTSGKPNI